MPTTRRPLVLLVALASLSGCGRTPTPVAGPPASVIVRRTDPDKPASELMDEDGAIAPIGFAFANARGYIRMTMEIEGATDAPGPFVHDALFLAKGEGRLSIAVREPWPGHERGRVSIRCEGDGEDSTVVYEPELWFGPPAVPANVEFPSGDGPTSVREGNDLVLARVVAATGKNSRPMTVTFKVAFAAEPIKPRVKAGVRPPR